MCSYGYGGTVSHAVVEQFVSSSFETADANVLNGALDAAPVLLLVSVPQVKRLAKQASVIAEWLSSPEGKEVDLVAVANTLAQRRAHHDYRLAFIADSHEAAATCLRAAAEDRLAMGHYIAKGSVLGAYSDPARAAVWIFSGHGAQWRDMGKELLLNAVFRQALNPLDAIVQSEAGFSILEALANGNFLEMSERIQILTYVVQIGLSQVLMSRGLMPEAVIGHSVGEIAASVVAGCLTAEEGTLVVTRRAMLYALIRRQSEGGMAMISRPFNEVAEELETRQDLVAAIDSSPSTCVISGELDALEKYVGNMKAQGIKAVRVKTDIAFHSPMLDQLVGPLEESLRDSLQPRQPTIPIYSTSNCNTRTKTLRDINYWTNNMVSPVFLKSAINATADDGYRVFVEVSTHPIILFSVNETLLDRGLNYGDMATLATMKQNTSLDATIMELTAELYVKGVGINFEVNNIRKQTWCPSVPGTLWVHKPYYRHVETSSPGLGILDIRKVISMKENDMEMNDEKKHVLLGQRTIDPNTNIVRYTARLSSATKPFPGIHPLDGTEIIPAAVYLNTFHQATGASLLSNVNLNVPVSLGSDEQIVSVVVDGEQISVL